MLISSPKIFISSSGCSPYLNSTGAQSGRYKTVVAFSVAADIDIVLRFQPPTGATALNLHNLVRSDPAFIRAQSAGNVARRKRGIAEVVRSLFKFVSDDCSFFIRLDICVSSLRTKTFAFWRKKYLARSPGGSARLPVRSSNSDAAFCNYIHYISIKEFFTKALVGIVAMPFCNDHSHKLF